MKLQKALDNYRNNVHKHCNVIYGIEITCADRLHVVGMFREEQLGEVERWLSDHLISEEYGVNYLVKRIYIAVVIKKNY